MPGRIIAIDGPAASGKSSVSRGVAAALGFLFVSSGYFYRAVAWHALQFNQSFKDQLIDFDSPESITSWALCLTIITQTDSRIFIDGEDATNHLHDAEVVALVSKLAAVPAVREIVNDNLHRMAKSHDLVMEGRDIGSVVFPETPYKFYLDASPEERARRRAREGMIDSVAERDRLDSTRTTAPLVIPEGATVIDTTNLNLEQVIEKILERLTAVRDVTISPPLT